MKTRPILYVATAIALFAAGCGGPGIEGMKARAAARARIDDFNAQFAYDQALQDFETGQFDRALRNVEGAISEDPSDVRFHLLRGRIYLETNQLEQAMNAFTRTLAEDSDSADAHYFAGIVYQRWSDDEQAFDEYFKAFDLAPNKVEYLLATAEALVSLGELQRARELVESKMAYFEHDPALRHLLGQISLLEGDAKTAARLYGEAQLLSPGDAGLLEELAWVQYDAEMYGQCYETVQRIEAQLEEPRVDLVHLEARCLAILDRDAEAHERYLQLTHLDPSNPSVWIEFGTLAWKVGDFRRVAECSSRTIEMAPDRFEGYMLKGLYERNEGRVDEAIDLLRQASRRSGASVLPHLLLGRTLDQAGHAREALTAYRQAVSIDPENTDARALHDALEAQLQVATAEPD